MILKKRLRRNLSIKKPAISGLKQSALSDDWYARLHRPREGDVPPTQ
ncbi:hypothetical protein yberc0001_36540 [Yersinia bercovieri ATCC 43970]|uniref:Uncharacterized protein n=1 Tax=Yersinia bercovieri ATCC 43970 TaxID=349968 RepID=A0ABM9XUG6_YERBE|nr:hypothetical protein yberc0001_36540 [Yersinia bercovieri ATCC 43970]